MIYLIEVTFRVESDSAIGALAEMSKQMEEKGTGAIQSVVARPATLEEGMTGR